MRLTHFLTDESGAISVEWVVLTASIASLGFATVAVMAVGLEDLTVEVSNSLSTMDVGNPYRWAREVLSLDFSGTNGGFIGGAAMNVGGQLGEVLVIGPGQLAEKTFDLPADALSATLTFDLIGGDSLDHERATILINGVPVSVATGAYGSISFTTPEVPGITVTTNTVAANTELGGRVHDGIWTESVTIVSISVDTPGDTLRLGVHSGANQPIDDEFFAIDSLSLSTR